MSYVVGTAGHIDHGKSTLIHALTGIDPDRLAEEKRRGMTIDLGFAYLTLPSGRLVGIVDVPGHARFIRNMLAGVHGLDAVLLVVAADEGVMPQTREHLEIVDLLEISQGLVALTKVDLVEPDWLELVTEETRDALAGTSLEGAAILPVSGVTGQGLDGLRSHLDALLSQTAEREDRGRPRLPVDRAFTISGFGTVVTGTLVDGRMRAGEELDLLPSGRRVRVRGLQQHNRTVEVAEPGSRVAANLAGIDPDDVRRGEVLARTGMLTASRRVDASVRVVKDAAASLRHGAHLVLHTGTAEAGCRAIVLGGDQIPPGGTGWLQLYLERPLAVAAGDHFVLRRPSPSATVAGGTFTDVDPRRHARFDEHVRASLQRRAAGDVLQEELRKYPRGITEQALRRATLADDADSGALDARRAGQWLFARDAWDALVERARKILAGYHSAHPLREGMPREELKSRLRLHPSAFGPVLAELVQEGVLVERGPGIALPAHRVELDGSQGGPARKLIEILSTRPFAPPSLAEALREAGAGAEVARALTERGELVRLSEDVVFTKEAFEGAVEHVRALAERDGSVTVATLRDRLGASRRPALALLEHLDAQRVTRRVGDARVLR